MPAFVPYSGKERSKLTESVGAAGERDPSRRMPVADCVDRSSPRKRVPGDAPTIGPIASATNLVTRDI
eukprot:scaffold54726_cov31-Tisochrysis_lutea.AAC.3